jgi:hypothetical protein
VTGALGAGPYLFAHPGVRSERLRQFARIKPTPNWGHPLPIRGNCFPLGGHPLAAQALRNWDGPAWNAACSFQSTSMCRMADTKKERYMLSAWASTIERCDLGFAVTGRDPKTRSQRRAFGSR